MIREIVATDGKVVGKLEHLAALSSDSPDYRVVRGYVYGINPSPSDRRFCKYDISTGGWIGSLTLRENMEPIVRQVLGLENTQDLLGAPVLAYVNRDHVLVGFMGAGPR